MNETKRRVYKVWSVYETEYLVRYYVLNLKTKKVHSVWHNWSEAVETAKDLNSYSAWGIA